MMRIPQATYRLQFHPGFGFREAKKLVPYLAELGISDLYASPVFRAREGSMHGYDVLDPTELNPELGTPEDFAALAEALRSHQMGWVQDIVPNHMAFDGANPYLRDVLENGERSPYVHFFDIDWEHYYENIHGKLLAPFLTRFYGDALERGEIRLDYGEEGFSVVYGALRFPLRIESYLDTLTLAAAGMGRALGEEHPDYVQFLGILYVIKTLAAAASGQVRFIKQILWSLYRKNRTIRRAIDQAVKRVNGRVGDPESFNRLEGLLAEQFFRLAFWKVASEEINYRRFFSINDLISLNMERKEVFSRTHTLVLRCVEEGLFSGLRIDHVDGLYDPAGYLQRLRGQVGRTYLVVEKITAPNEELPPWPVQGTTGYDFLNRVNALFCRLDAERAFSSLYRGYSGLRTPWKELLYGEKRLIIEKHLLGDINNLAHLLKNIAGRHRYGSDITMDSLKRGLIEIMALFPVYRSYLGTAAEGESDRRIIAEAVDRARELNPGLLIELDYIARILLLEFDPFLSEEEKVQWRHFVMRFQQFTGALMAKGYEDTLCYVYNRLLSLNEVGGSPDRFGISAEAFHRFCGERRERWPHTLNATATHDSKRGEDVRARLNVLSELSQEWSRQLRTWSRINRGKKGTVKRHKVPDRNDEYLFYQTLVGTFPFAGGAKPEYVRRIKEYLVKAVREAKVHTAWLKPDSDYEEAFLRFVDAVLVPRRGNPFLGEFLPFQRRVAFFGMLNGLAQTLLKITTPGVPDFYQGTELWDLSLVDPDNRRPVDYERRKRALAEICRWGKDLAGLLAAMEDGRVKLFLIHRALALRNRNPDLFRQGSYLPLEVDGPHRESVVAFARRHGGRCALVVVPRFLTGLVDTGELPLGEALWQDTRVSLPEGCAPRWWDALAGEEVSASGALPVGRALQRFPVALLANFR